MGYTTDFNGGFKLSRNLTEQETEIINKISEDRHDSIYNYGDVRRAYPSIWNQWVIERSYGGNDLLVWDEGEKFYQYVGWLSYLIVNYFDQWEVELNGVVDFDGEDREDRGEIHIKNSEISVYQYNYTLKDVTTSYKDSIINRNDTSAVDFLLSLGSI